MLSRQSLMIFSWLGFCFRRSRSLHKIATMTYVYGSYSSLCLPPEGKRAEWRDLSLQALSVAGPHEGFWKCCRALLHGARLGLADGTVKFALLQGLTRAARSAAGPCCAGRALAMPMGTVKFSVAGPHKGLLEVLLGPAARGAPWPFRWAP